MISVPVGSVITYDPRIRAGQVFGPEDKDRPRPLKADWVELPDVLPVVSFRDDHRSPPLDPTDKFSVPSESRCSLFIECLVPEGGKLGKGTIKWRHGGSNPAVYTANQICATVIDSIGADLDRVDVEIAGNEIGRTSEWPHGVRGKQYSMDVDGEGRVVGDVFYIRLESALTSYRGVGADSWFAVINNIEVEIEIEPLDVDPVEEVDPVEAQVRALADALGIDYNLLYVLIMSIRGI